MSHQTVINNWATAQGWTGYQRLGGLAGIEYKITHQQFSEDILPYVELGFDSHGNVIEVNYHKISDGRSEFDHWRVGQGKTSKEMCLMALAALRRVDITPEQTLALVHAMAVEA